MAKYEVELHKGQGPKIEIEADHVSSGPFVSFYKTVLISNISQNQVVKLIDQNLVREVTLVSE